MSVFVKRATMVVLAYRVAQVKIYLITEICKQRFLLKFQFSSVSIRTELWGAIKHSRLWYPITKGNRQEKTIYSFKRNNFFHLLGEEYLIWYFLQELAEGRSISHFYPSLVYPENRLSVLKELFIIHTMLHLIRCL